VPPLEAIQAAAGVALGAAAQSVVSDAIDRAKKTLTERAGAFAISLKNRAVVDLRIGFNDFLKASYERCRTFKTILSPQEPLDVVTHYVNVDLSLGNKKIKDVDLISNIIAAKCVVVTGLAGTGKSMFMKYLTVDLFQKKSGSLPLFVELRHLNGFAEKNLFAFIRRQCSSKANRVSDDQFELALRTGVFTLILDGFDELDYDCRDEVERQILRLRIDYPDLAIVVSSRPDDRFGSWNAFYVYTFEPMTKEQSVKLISSLQYDKGVKRRFLKEVRGRLYDSHKSFLSSPLLTTIMLLTYEEFAEIPSKMHSFYGQAFDTLLQKHDAQKDQFQRKTRTGLAREDFRALFSAFCAISYLENNFSFSSSKLTETAKKAIEYASQTIGAQPGLTTEKLILDLKEVVCMLQPDGLEMAFVHRSFQEYFSALFVVSLHASKVKKVVDKFSRRLSDSVLIMARDMAQETIEREWVLPKIAEIKEALDLTAVNEANIANFTEVLFGRFRFYIWGDGFDNTFHVNDLLAEIAALGQLYPARLSTSKLLESVMGQRLNVVRPLLTDEKHLGKWRYKKFQTFFQSQPSGNGRPNATMDLNFDQRDSWWLKELGLMEVANQLNKSFDRIIADIEKRDKKRSVILADLL